MRGKRVTAAVLGGLAGLALLWLGLWAVGATSYVPGPVEAAGVIATLLALEAWALQNAYPGDTESEIIRRLGRERRLMPNLAGTAFGAGLALAVHWPTAQEASILRAGLLTYAAAYLMAHFFEPPWPGRREPDMSTALGCGALSGMLLLYVSQHGAGSALEGYVLVAAAAWASGWAFFPLHDDGGSDR